jgi:hypothetical protein
LARGFEVSILAAECGSVLGRLIDHYVHSILPTTATSVAISISTTVAGQIGVWSP